MIFSLIGFLLTISGDMTALELSSIASRMARSNIIEKGSCVRFDFERAPDVRLCRTERGTPYFCKVFVFSSWLGYEQDVCEEFNEI